ncbi:MAG: hypothetical protein JWS12_887 [Candidatus Saccharibacteria bacterium]|nr:hypothetical protein [Candidatus Saccharibacteria bacterium]
MSKADTLPRIYGLATVLTVALLAVVLIWGTGADLIKVLILAGLEITFSFDNAVVNARILQRLNRFWQQLFMTVGIAIAVFGVRVLLPLLLVSLTAHISIGEVWSLALKQPTTYADKLLTAHPMIAAFGGIFLLMIFLDFVFEERETKWLKPLERTLAAMGKLESLSTITALSVLLIASGTLVPSHERLQVLTAALLGLLVYLAINALDSFFSHDKLLTKNAAGTAAKMGLVGFIYLELIDASFSLDGVIGAFAITSKVLLIAAGLGIGALYVRAMTVHLLRRGTLAKYRYMEHGAHYAIGILAVLMLLTLKYDVPEAVTGLSGVIVIVTAIIHSHTEAKHT